MDPHRGLRSIVAAWWRGSQRGRSEGARRRPAIEPLETRRLLATIAEFPTPTANSRPEGIAAGPDGRIWFTEPSANKIGSIDPNTHHIDEYDIPTASSWPYGIAPGPDGHFWFTENLANKIGVIDPISHHVDDYTISTAGSEPGGIVEGSDGLLWFTEFAANKIGSIDPATHHIDEFTLPTAGSEPAGIAAGSDGLLWFTESAANKIGSIDPVGRRIPGLGVFHAIAEYALPTAGSGPWGIAAGPDGFLWFTERTGDRIGTIDPTSDHIAQYSIPTAGSDPVGIAAGMDGLLWFTEDFGGKVGSIDPAAHAIAEYATPTIGPEPYGIASGPEGNLWFTEVDSSKVGVLAPPLALTVTAGPPAVVAPGAAFGLTVSVSYQTGRPDTGFDGTVTLALAGPGGATLGGTITVAARHGVATFTGLSIDRPGTYRILASLDPQTATMTAPLIVDAPPTIVAAAPVLAGRGRHERLVGFELDFSAAMDPARAASPADYSLVQYRRRHRRLIARPVGLRAAYDAAAHRVELTLSGRPRFAAGGRLAVVGTPPSGLTDAAGTLLDGGNTGASGDNASFVISPKGRALSR